MLIDFSVVITDLRGEPIQDEQEVTENGKKVRKLSDVTLRDVAVGSLLYEKRDTPITDGKEKIKLFRLAEKIYGAKEPINIDFDNIVMIKEKIAKAYSIVVTGRAWSILEPELPEKKITKEKK